VVRKRAKRSMVLGMERSMERKNGAEKAKKEGIREWIGIKTRERRNTAGKTAIIRRNGVTIKNITTSGGLNDFTHKNGFLTQF